MAPERVFVGLGANLGDAAQALRLAIGQLASLPATRVVGVSSLYASEPIDAQGPDFVNAVAELATALEPLPLLQALHQLETAQGRERPYRHAPRTLDLDLLLYGQRVLNEPGLEVPHPRLLQRAFVLQPLLELAPELIHPQAGAVAPMLAALADQRLRRLA